MAGDNIDISILGDKELSRRLHRLEGRVQKKVLRVALRQSVRKIIKPAILQALAGNPVMPRTGRLLSAMRAIKPKAGLRRRHWMQIFIPMPERSALGIAAGAKGYYPTALEYGHDNVPARSWIRRPVNAVEGAVKAMWRQVIGKGIRREAKRKA